MATVMETSCIEQIGETAGQVWDCLSERGPMSLSKLSKLVNAPRDVVMQAAGWLAREDKIQIEERSRGRMIWLK